MNLALIDIDFYPLPNLLFIFSTRRHFAKQISSLFLFTSLSIISQVPTSLAKENSTSTEQRTAQYFESIRHSPPQQLAFLLQMPKGGDIHNHLSGAIYAESYIQWAADRALCVQPVTLSVTTCEPNSGTLPVAQALTDQRLYDRLVNAWSMRFWPYSGNNGHDQFFETFGKFSEATNGQTGKMLAEAASRAAANRVSYLELMLTPASSFSKTVGQKVGWDGSLENTWQKLENEGIAKAVTLGQAEIEAAESEKNRLLNCHTPQADPGCSVTIRYLAQIARDDPLEQVFAQMVTGFRLASNLASPFVGINLVQPEDGLRARQNFRVQMQMLNFLHQRYPQAQITLHAGELAPGLVPPEDRSFHIRESVLTGKAQRIGHGVDIMREHDPYNFMKELVKRNILIEICLSSNDLILGVRGNQHPLNIYLAQGVPVALATDDQGIARSELSEEFLRASQDQGLTYPQLKTLARNSLEYAFIEGKSLWQDYQKRRVNTVCALDFQTSKPLSTIQSKPCQQFITHNPKARLQWQLEKDFQQFESQY